MPHMNIHQKTKTDCKLRHETYSSEISQERKEGKQNEIFTTLGFSDMTTKARFKKNILFFANLKCYDIIKEMRTEPQTGAQYL